MWYTAVILWMAFVVAALGTQARTQFSRNESANNPDTKRSSLCHVIDHQGDKHAKAVCKGLSSMQELTSHLTVEQLPLITTLTIASSNISCLTLDDFVDLPSLHTLMLNHSYISDWKTSLLTSHPNVTTLVLNHCWDNATVQIIGMEPVLTLTSEMLSVFPSLEDLHIVDCYLVHLDRLDNVKNLHKLNIVDGGLGCEEDKLWILDWIDLGRATVSNTTTCYVPSFSMNLLDIKFSFNAHPFLVCMGYHKNTQRECMPPCKCDVMGIKENLFPIIRVHCQVAGLTELPQIPRYTTRINVTGNNISDMSMLFTHERYRHIDLITLDHNRISHMDGKLFYNFVKNRSDIGISLSHNTLSTLPVREIRQVFNEAVQEGESYLPHLGLGNNPWNCDDCDFLSEFQAILYYQSPMVTSLIDIRCSDQSANNAGQQIITLDVKSQCAHEPPLLQPIDILNICMGILLLLIILNFLHNFVQYRRHGNLPWIITKLPCC
ncbi:protein singed wings 2-like isoform X2 [Panulirus ornatus]